MPHVVVWDIETVPDLRGFAAANGLDGKSDHKTRAAIGDKLPTLPNRCIAATDAGKNTPSQSGRESHWQEFILRAPNAGRRPGRLPGLPRVTEWPVARG
jgi:hypothetical protein